MRTFAWFSRCDWKSDIFLVDDSPIFGPDKNDMSENKYRCNIFEKYLIQRNSSDKLWKWLKKSHKKFSIFSLDIFELIPTLRQYVTIHLKVVSGEFLSYKKFLEYVVKIQSRQNSLVYRHFFRNYRLCRWLGLFKRVPGLNSNNFQGRPLSPGYNVYQFRFSKLCQIRTMRPYKTREKTKFWKLGQMYNFV